MGRGKGRMRLAEISGSGDFMKLNARLFESQNGKTADTPTKNFNAGVSTSRTFAPKMNKSEEAVALCLKAKYPGAVVISQPSRFFRLHGGGTYTPDFLVFRPGVSTVIVVEVKGGYKGSGAEQGYERYKRTALEWNGDIFKFEMWRKKDGKMWKWEIITWGE